MDIKRDKWIMAEDIPIEDRYKLTALLSLAGFTVSDHARTSWERRKRKDLYIAHAYNREIFDIDIVYTYEGSIRHKQLIGYTQLKTLLIDLIKSTGQWTY